jgi:hypothetical protein
VDSLVSVIVIWSYRWRLLVVGGGIGTLSTVSAGALAVTPVVLLPALRPRGKPR